MNPANACSAGQPTTPLPLAAPPVTPPHAPRLATALGIDTRALAAFRIGIGLILLADIALRATDLVAFYTDRGIVPRTLVAQANTDSLRFSIHMFAGHPLLIAALFALAALFAAMLTLGWRTRLATIASWTLLVSLQNRNPWINQGGDDILRLLLFWSIFLPLGIRASVDAALNTNTKPQPRSITSVASAALLIQLAVMYLASALFKNHPTWFERGDAVWTALHADQLVRPLGLAIREHPALCEFLTHSTILLELLGPILVFLPVFKGWLRAALALAFISFHAGLAATMHLGHFPFVCMVAWLAFLPTDLWDRLTARARHAPPTTIHYDRDCAFCIKMVALVQSLVAPANTTARPAQSDPDASALMQAHNSWVVTTSGDKPQTRFDALITLLRASPLLFPLAPLAALPPVRAAGNAAYRAVAKRRHRAARLLAPLHPRPLSWTLPRPTAALALALLALMLSHNVQRLRHKLPESSLEQAAYQLTRLDQKWTLFAPRPLSDDGWWVFVATLDDGSRIDLANPAAPLSFERPDRLADTYPSIRWRKLLRRMRHAHPDNPTLADHTARFLATTYNPPPGDSRRIIAVEPTYILEKTRPLGVPPFTARPQPFGLWTADPNHPAQQLAHAPDED